MKRNAVVFSLILLLTMIFLLGSGSGETSSPAEEFEDGVYFATYSHVDSHGWQPYLEFRVEGGEIASAVFDYVAPDGTLKTHDQEYRERMREASGTHPGLYTSQLESSLMENQDAPVEAVSGATSSSRWFNELATELVSRAESGETSDAVLPMNTTYTAEDEPDERGGWVGHIEITYEDGEIVEVVYDEVQKQSGEIVDRKSENEEYAQRYAEVNEITPAEVYESLESQLLATEDPQEVDTVSGASITSPRFRELAEAAMEQRVSAEVPRKL